jgi:beta-glucuronidase
MIRPQTNAFREAIDLSGIWQFCADRDGAQVHDIAIPGSWNEQLAEAGYMNFTGTASLSRDVFVPARAAGQRVLLRFGSADYRAEVFWNDVAVGTSGSLKLPFDINLTGVAVPGATARLTVRVSGELPEGAPMQRVAQADYAREGRIKDEYFPAVRFDFFPFAGLNRAVHLVLEPAMRIADYRVRTGVEDDAGIVRIDVDAIGLAAVDIRLEGQGQTARQRCRVADARATCCLEIADARLWRPTDPALYTLTIEGQDERGAVVDRVAQQVGIRTIVVDGHQLLLNGVPIALKGFGKHEDAPVSGRGVNLPMLVKDFELLRWTGANSVRTAHYPYDEAFYDFADRNGILVIDEVFSVNLDFRRIGDGDIEAHKRAVSDLIARDGNRTCVIAWSLANEPGYLGEADYAHSDRYWADLFAHARALDPSRPLTHANVHYAGEDDPAFAHADILSINRYHGWYDAPGQIARGAEALKATLDRLAMHGKPLFVSEFGADALAGAHATTDQMFTEEYQADFIAAYWAVIAAHPACIGGHVWNFADFRTAQHSRRVVHNLKGVFTRTREPKRAAFTCRDLWSGA